jgi:twitching motility protein PilI
MSSEFAAEAFDQDLTPVAVADPFESLIEYERRSLAHVAGLPEQLQAAGLWRGIGYRIGQRRLVSEYEAVAEILTVPQIMPVPGAQPWMLGVANVRGNLLPVVDLKQFLEGTRSVLHEGHQKVIVLRQPGGDVAVTIDELYGQRSFFDEQRLDQQPLEHPAAERPADERPVDEQSLDDQPSNDQPSNDQPFNVRQPEYESLVEGRYAGFIDRAYRLADDVWGVFSFDRLVRTPEFRHAAV